MGTTGELTVEIVTQSGVEYQGPVDGVVAPGTRGYLGVRIGHAPLLSSLSTGLVTLHCADGDTFIAVTGGMMEVFDNRVTVLADAAERAAEIDIGRARRAMQRAKERLAAAYTPDGRREVDPERARMALARALNRLHTAEKAGLLGS